MVYYDGIHLMADTLDELHAFAANAGLKKEWFQNHKKHPHYDVWGGRNERAVLRLGAKEVSSKDLVVLANKLYCSLPAVINQVCDKCGDTGNMGNPTLSEPDGQRCNCNKQTCL